MCVCTSGKTNGIVRERETLGTLDRPSIRSYDDVCLGTNADKAIRAILLIAALSSASSAASDERDAIIDDMKCHSAKASYEMISRIYIKASREAVGFCAAVAPTWSPARIKLFEQHSDIYWSKLDFEALDVELPSWLILVRLQRRHTEVDISIADTAWWKPSRVDDMQLSLLGRPAYLGCEPSWLPTAKERGGELCFLETQLGSRTILILEIATLIRIRDVPSEWPLAKAENEIEWQALLDSIEKFLG